MTRHDIRQLFIDTEAESKERYPEKDIPCVADCASHKQKGFVEGTIYVINRLIVDGHLKIEKSQYEA